MAGAVVGPVDVEAGLWLEAKNISELGATDMHSEMLEPLEVIDFSMWDFHSVKPSACFSISLQIG